MTLPVVFTANGPTGYNLTRSLRFRSSASAYLNRTPASTTNRQIWTWSAWVKQGSDLNSLFSTNASDNNSYNYFGFSSNSFRLYQWNGSGYDFQFITTAVYRDPSAWYHFVIQVDTTQATAANRVRLYVNGTQVTAFSTNTTPSQNLNTYVNNSSYSHLLARNPAGSSTYFDGYLAEVNFIDGQALTPTSFGSFNALTGVWQPARYTGTYGTNGFYLPFTDNSALTTSSNVGLGRDYSGNGNYWTTNNISITAGTTYDSMTDVPTLTSATAANYCVLNPLDDNPSLVLSNGNLNASIGSASWVKVRATFGMPTGKWYFEYTPTSADSHSVGVMRASDSLSGILGAGSFEYGYWQAGYIYAEGGLTAVATYTTNDVIGITFDAGTREVKFYKNNTLQATDTVASTEMYFPALSENAGNGAMNFGQRPFSYTPPTGFVALNTFNLPNSTIVAGNKQMDATLYTGTGATQSIVNAGSMQPDFVWIKARSTTTNNRLYDSVRGATLQIQSNNTDAEAVNANGLTAFVSNGFTVGSASSENASGQTFVGWQWKAGGTAVTNTAGSISSQVSANTTSGFSVVTYTGSGLNATVGHGLGVAPSWVIVKGRNVGSTNWFIYTATQGATKYLDFSTGTGGTDSSSWNNTAPTSSVFSVGTSYYTNFALTTYVAYCWSEIAGYSAFGSYTGNGSTDGPFVYTGFRPRFVIIKRSDGVEPWLMLDSARQTYNVMGPYLLANASDAEATFSFIDFTSNGFKIRNTGGSFNTSGGTYIYMAFAENPFKNALAR
jgi:hypothetical protein